MNIDNAEGTGSSDIEHKSIMVTRGNNNTFTLSTTKHIDLINPSRFQTKYSKLKCPRFDGTNFKGWLLQIELSHFRKGQGTHSHDARGRKSTAMASMIHEELRSTY